MHALAIAASTAAAARSDREAIGWGLLIAGVLAIAIKARRSIRGTSGGGSWGPSVVHCEGGHSGWAWALGVLIVALVLGYGYDRANPHPAAHAAAPAPAPTKTVIVNHTITKIIHEAPSLSGTDIVLIVLIVCIAGVGVVSLVRRFL